MNCVASVGHMEPSPIAILSALAQEQEGLIALLRNPLEVRHAGREFWCGELCGRPVVLALSRIGKVAAATTAAALIERFGVPAIVFTGVAGGVGAGVRIGDVVVGDSFLQHDMDASPLFARYQVPLSGRAVFTADAPLTAQLLAACQQAMADQRYAGQAVTVHRGLIASGDRFVSSAQELARIDTDLQSHGYRPLAIEMEGAAVAQTCADYGVAFAAVRTVSDRADGQAHVDFLQFVQATASQYARTIVLQLMQSTQLQWGQISPLSRNSRLAKA